MQRAAAFTAAAGHVMTLDIVLRSVDRELEQLGRITSLRHR
jgi:hypothetical protein